jgi:lysozyme
MDDDILLLLALGLLGGALYQYLQQQNATAVTAAPVATTPVDLSTTPDATSVNDILSPIGTPTTTATVTTLDSAGTKFIQNNEGGFHASAYADGAGQAIGYGHEILPTDNIKSPITQSQANSLFNSDIANVVNAINAYVKVPLTQNQLDALADLIYDIGTTAFAGSTLLALLNQGSYAGAAAQFNAWIYSTNAAGQTAINNTLVTRRAAETAMFNNQVA